MNTPAPRPLRCAIYTRKSSEEGLEQSFNSLDAQREAAEAFIKSQAHEGWVALPTAYDDGGFSGGTMDRPALARLLDAIEQRQIDVVVVYKVDRLSRSLADFVRLVELFDQHSVSFVSVTQQFNTSSSMGRLTLNVLLSFAQFEREVTSERIRDKIAASKQKGMWMGGLVPLGYDRVYKQLVINAVEADQVRHMYARYLALGCVRRLKEELTRDGYVSKARRAGSKHTGGKPFARGALYTILKNPVYIGKVAHKGKLHKGKHEPLLDPGLWKDVQERLAANRHRKRTRANARTPSLLAGLLFDDCGNPMSPTQSHRGSRRYRYYISQALLQYREHEAGSVARVPADSLETLVADQWLAFLGDGARLLDAIGADGWPASEQHALLDQAKALATAWSDGTMPQRIEQLQRWRPRITIGRDALRIELPGESVRTLWGARTKAAATRSCAPIEWTVPVALKRSGIETKLVIPSGRPPLAHTASATALREAVEKALTWNQALLADPAKSTCSLAKAEGVAQRFIAQRLQLAWLAPDIIQRIIAGNIPDTLTLGQFRYRRIPLDWAEQRAFFQIT